MDAALEGTKARLRLLSRLADPEEVAEELQRLSASRDADLVPEAR